MNWWRRLFRGNNVAPDAVIEWTWEIGDDAETVSAGDRFTVTPPSRFNDPWNQVVLEAHARIMTQQGFLCLSDPHHKSLREQ